MAVFTQWIKFGSWIEDPLVRKRLMQRLAVHAVGWVRELDFGIRCLKNV
jgi:hypothetical protein